MAELRVVTLVVKQVSDCLVSEIVPVCLHFMNSYLFISGTFWLAGSFAYVRALFTRVEPTNFM